MEPDTLLRLALLYVHLLLCVFALQAVLHTDWLVLRGRLVAQELLGVHRRLLWLLSALWISGLGIAAIDLGLDWHTISGHPKLIGKLTAVTVLTLNGLLLRYWCFPRLFRRLTLSYGEHVVLLAIGAASTTSWLMAAFFGIARPLSQWPMSASLLLYGAALAASLLAAVALAALTWHHSVAVGQASQPDAGASAGSVRVAP